MLKLIRMIAFFSIAWPLMAQKTTWYVRADGGTRFSIAQPSGLCDGKADAAPTGTAPNQHCAFNDYRFLYTDGTYGNAAWVISGGDTVIVDSAKPWRVGYNGPDPTDYFGVSPGDPYDDFNPPIPPGTAAGHTRILGRNYAACNQQNMTQIFGGFGIFAALSLRATSFVDVQCIELTRHSQCAKFGTSPAVCNSNYPLDDYALNGIVTDAGTHDINLQDVWIHGFVSRGIIGPIGGTVTAVNVDIAINGGAGWDFDDGSGTPSVNAVLNLNNSTIEWNGCNQAYPGAGSSRALVRALADMGTESARRMAPVSLRMSRGRLSATTRRMVSILSTTRRPSVR